MDNANTWRVQRMGNTYRWGARTLSHPFMAVTPGCPTEPHPTRECRCKPFRTEREANEYVAEQRYEDSLWLIDYLKEHA